MRIEKTIGEFIANRKSPVAAPGDSVVSAVEVMKQSGQSCVLVCEADRLVGIFTERDFLNRIAAAERDPTTTILADVMTSEPGTLTPEDCVTYAINRMAVGGYRNVPIVDRDGRVVANLSVRDVLSHIEDVFAEVDEDDYHESSAEWTDIGGG